MKTLQVVPDHALNNVASLWESLFLTTVVLRLLLGYYSGPWVPIS